MLGLAAFARPTAPIEDQQATGDHPTVSPTASTRHRVTPPPGNAYLLTAGLRVSRLSSKSLARPAAEGPCVNFRIDQDMRIVSRGGHPTAPSELLCWCWCSSLALNAVSSGQAQASGRPRLSSSPHRRPLRPDRRSRTSVPPIVSAAIDANGMDVRADSCPVASG